MMEFINILRMFEKNPVWFVSYKVEYSQLGNIYCLFTTSCTMLWGWQTSSCLKHPMWLQQSVILCSLVCRGFRAAPYSYQSTVALKLIINLSPLVKVSVIDWSLQEWRPQKCGIIRNMRLVRERLQSLMDFTSETRSVVWWFGAAIRGAVPSSTSIIKKHHSSWCSFTFTHCNHIISASSLKLT